MLQLTKEELKSYQDGIVYYICGKSILNNGKDKNHQKVRDHCHYIGRCST